MPAPQPVEFERSFLQAHGIGLTPEAFVRLVHRIVARSPRVSNRDPGRELAPEEAQALARGGFDLSDRDLGERDPVARAAAELALLVETSLSVQQAAKFIDVDESRIRQRLTSERSLYGFQWEKKWRIPRFQFEESRCLPHLAEVVSALREGLHPLTVHDWFLRPAIDLYDDEHGRNLSPREWLLLGKEPEEVVRIAKYLV